MTLSLAAVFIPLLFMGGIIGRLFHEFAVTIARRDSRLGLRVADAHADALSRFLRAARARREARPVLSGRRSACTSGCSACTSAARLGDGASPADAGVLGADPRRHRRAVHGRAEGLHPERGHGPAHRHDRSGAGHVVRRHGRSTSRQVAAIVPAGSERRRLHVGGRRRRRRPTIEPGPAVHRPQAARRAQLSADEIVARAATRSSSRVPGHRGRSCRIRRRSRSAGASSKSLYQFTLQSARHRRRCITAAQQLERRCASVAAAAGRHERPADRAIRRCSVEIDRDRAASLGVTRDADRERARTTRTARGRCRRSTRRTTSTGW